MTHALATEPLSARVFLLGEGHGPATVAGLQSAMEDRGVAGLATDGIRRLSSEAVRAVRGDVASAIGGLLDIDLADLVVGGWRTHARLTAAARRTWEAPGTSETVDLLRHTVTSTYQPHVDVMVEDIRVARIEVTLAVTFQITALAATVHEGLLHALAGGPCVVQGSLAIHDVPVLTRSKELDLQLLVPLGSGVPLLPPAERRSERRYG